MDVKSKVSGYAMGNIINFRSFGATTCQPGLILRIKSNAHGGRGIKSVHISTFCIDIEK